MRRTKGKILWVDDEIDHLKSHTLFLEERGYVITPVTNAEDAISLIQKDRFDLMLLDEMMPGLDGLQALSMIKEIDPALPVIMVTRSEEENLMEEAIGGKIEDYLTKPVNPSQILSSCKRILEKNQISREKVARDYTTEFGEITNLLNGPMSANDWIEVHVKLSERELDLDLHTDLGLNQSLQDQRRECNKQFGWFIEKNYELWVSGKNKIDLSTNVVKKYLFPLLREGKKVLFIVVDNFRIDQWLTIESILYEYFTITRHYYFSILPTATPYSRNSIFAGLFPREIAQMYPDLWQKGDDDENSRNRYEYRFLLDQLKRNQINLKPEPKYIRIMNPEDTRNVVKNFNELLSVPLSAMVFNFVDILAHRRSDSEILREIVPDESAYRSLTRTWFEHSALFQILKIAASSDISVILTTDHGSIRAMHGTKVYADRETSTNVRYKYGRGIRGEQKHVIDIKEPEKFGLPIQGININYLITKEDYYFVYPTNYHKYLALYRDSFQHGGVSLEEMILPFVILEKR